MKKSRNNTAEELAFRQGQENKKNGKMSTSEIMDAIIDRDALQKRKDAQSKAVHKTQVEELPPKEKEWWEKIIEPTDFTVKEFNSKFYARLDVWSDNVWIGPYYSKGEITDVISNYCAQTKKKDRSERKFTNLHSVIVNI